MSGSQSAKSCWLSLALIMACTATSGRQRDRREPVIGGPCEGCEAVFQGLPSDLSPRSRISSVGEPGEAMRILGRVLRHADGSPAPGTIIYAYHTNAQGIYPPNERFPGQAARRHGTLRGWVQVGADGGYQFDTVRPASYPNSSEPQHVHLQVIEPDRCTYWIDSIVFEDDPLLTPSKLRQHDQGRGGSGIVTPRRGEGGVWLVERDIILGKAIPGYR